MSIKNSKNDRKKTPLHKDDEVVKNKWKEPFPVIPGIWWGKVLNGDKDKKNK